MQKWAESFYKSAEWEATRKAYAKSQGWICERCRDAGLINRGIIVHHKIWLTQDNINDPDISLSWDNLKLVCRDCHAAEHRNHKRRYIVGEYGEIICINE